MSSPSKVAIARHIAGRIEQWASAGDIGARTAEGYRKLLDRQIVPHIGDVPLQRLGTADVERWHSRLRGAGLSPRTVKHAHALLRKALGDAVRHGQMMRNVCAHDAQRAPKVPKKKPRILLKDEIADFVEKLELTEIFPQAMVALFCGLRAGEVLALQWQPSISMAQVSAGQGKRRGSGRPAVDDQTTQDRGQRA